MYNGVGLATARGSGTSGYVQRSLAVVKSSRKEGVAQQRLREQQAALTKGTYLTGGF